MRLVVTGGAGFIGSKFVTSALDDESLEIEYLTVIDSLTYAGNLENLAVASRDSRYKFIQADISSHEDILQLLEGTSHVVNFAAESHVDQSISNPSKFIRTNVLGTHNMLEASLRHGVERFVQISTDEVYGSNAQIAWDESTSLDPSSPYSASKASGDILSLAYFKTFGLDVVITRACNNYGPTQHPEKLLPKTITRLSRGLSVPIYGDGKNEREWIHVSDHVQGIIKALRAGKPGEIYNLGSGESLSNLEIVSMICKILDKPMDLLTFVEDRLGHDLKYQINSSKAKIEIGYATEISLETGLLETVNWYRENPNWW